MSDDAIVTEMINFIEEKEKEIQRNRLGNDSQVRKNVIDSIIKKLGECTKNEN